MFVSAPGHLASTFDAPSSASTAPLRVVLRRAATLAFRPVSETGAALRGKLSLVLDGVPVVSGVTAAADGVVRHEFEPRGPGELHVFAVGVAPVVRRVTFAAGEVCDLGDLRFEEARTLRGRVLDLAGRAVAGAVVHPGDPTMNFAAGSTTTADGAFAGTWAPSSGPLPLRVTAEGFVPLHTVVDVSGDSSVTLTLARGGLLWGEVVDGDGAPVPDAKLRLVDERGTETPVAADVHGLVGVRVAAGRWTVHADGGVAESIAVAEGGDAHVRLVVQTR